MKQPKISRLRDLLGNHVVPGDVLLETKSGIGPGYYTLRLWEMPQRLDGSGYTYHIDGSRRLFRWTSLSRSIKIDMRSMPEGFEYSFYHGMYHLHTTLEDGTAEELIKASDWETERIFSEDVKLYEFVDRMIELTTLDDVKTHKGSLLKVKFVPEHILEKVLFLGHIQRSKVKNGEIGLAYFRDYMNFREIVIMA